MPTAASVADGYRLDWNLAKRLPVLDNDSSSGGSATVSVVDAPKNGTATVDGSVLVYTPKPGFFGEDSLRYRQSVGSASSEAEVKLTVEASLTVEGLVSDGPIANAKVVLKLGDKSFTADADANGRYSITVKTIDPGAFISLSAQGIGAQSHVVLESLVGEAKTLAGLNQSGKVTAQQLPALNVTHLSSAQVGLFAQQGQLPSTDAELKARSAKLKGFDIIDAAALIKMLVDDHVPLPAEAKTTQDLLNSAALYPAFTASALVKYGTRIESIQKNLMGDPALSSQLPKPSLDTVTLLYVSGLGGGTSPALRLILQPDGAASVQQQDVRKARWVHEGNQLTVLLDQAIVYKSDASTSGYPEFRDASADQVITGYQVREMGGQKGGRVLASVNILGYVEITDGPSMGYRIPRPSNWGSNWRIEDKQDFTDQDFASGKRWAGPLSAKTALGSLDAAYQDVMLVTGSGTGRMERTNESFNWLIDQGALVINLKDGSYRYRRIGLDPSGAERWLVEQKQNGDLVSLAEIMALPAEEVSVNTPMMTRKWRSNSGAQYRQDGYYSLRSDGAVGLVTLEYLQEDYAPHFKFRSWALKPDGQTYLYATRDGDGVLCTQQSKQGRPAAEDPDCKVGDWHTWKFVGKKGSTLFILDTLTFPKLPIGYRLHALTDAGEVK
ncbi:Ig-like domain-containing protein [Paucibacter sp. B2R-40]|uniref:Ig-like domain-containing protein n=1 Tax=Paucibacter sp. B2R-40 TaxID=2893554 RepID=UPI0021E4FDE7|nr:Ig-like domain-containing protein [Paucibacter sp. B2R-40]MCV2352878.1 Ig-like domain-containing protein [Paucibacter sp. B2R-40]